MSDADVSQLGDEQRPGTLTPALPEHSPVVSDWQVVSRDSHQVIISTGCTCGEPDHGWSGSSHESQWATAADGILVSYRDYRRATEAMRENPGEPEWPRMQP